MAESLRRIVLAAVVALAVGVPLGLALDPEESRRVLGLGFRAPEVVVVPQVWRLGSVDALFEIMRDGTVRTAGLPRAQTPKALEAIRADIREAVRRYQPGAGVDLPMPAVLSSAAKG